MWSKSAEKWGIIPSLNLLANAALECSQSPFSPSCALKCTPKELIKCIFWGNKVRLTSLQFCGWTFVPFWRWMKHLPFSSYCGPHNDLHDLLRMIESSLARTSASSPSSLGCRSHGLVWVKFLQVIPDLTLIHCWQNFPLNLGDLVTEDYSKEDIENLTLAGVCCHSSLTQAAMGPRFPCSAFYHYCSAWSTCCPWHPLKVSVPAELWLSWCSCLSNTSKLLLCNLSFSHLLYAAFMHCSSATSQASACYTHLSFSIPRWDLAILGGCP